MARGVSVVAALIAGVLVVAPQVRAQYYGVGTIRCESREYRDNYCPADTRGGVRLSRTLSRQPCWEGESWGYDRRGIWVTQGCAGEFEVGGARGGADRYGYQRGNPQPAPVPPGQAYGSQAYGYDRGGAAGGRRVICESRDYRYRYCPVGVGRDVDLARQLSKTPCRFDYSWGFDRGGVWVDRGCAAEFVVY
jgi:hypothetical protein